MAVPARPVAGNVMEAAWGQVAHDTAVAVDIQSGSAAISWAASPLSNNAVVVFPRAFASTPIVVAVLANPAGAQQPRLVGGIGSISATGFTFQGVETREAAVTATMAVHWVAIGPRL